MSAGRPSERHLGDGDLFLLTFPPAGEPEGLPEHLSSCGECSGRLAEWRRAANEIVGRPGTPLPDLERQVMDRIRTGALRPASRGRGRRIAVSLAAAACLGAAFWFGTRVHRVPAPPAPDRAMSEEDRADDRLLRDVARLIDDDEGDGGDGLAPIPEAPEGSS